MSQSMQNASGINGEGLSLLYAENEDPLALADTLKVVSCPICHAVYIPSSRQQAVMRGPEALLESAFLTVCHLCFRCQRPACPQCWNPIHHVCASCCEEARLPFRSPVPALEGLIFAAQATSQEAPLSFTCLRDGRFYTPDLPPHAEPLEQEKTTSPSPSSYPVTSGDLPALHNGDELQASSSPSWLREVLQLDRRDQGNQGRTGQNLAPFAPASAQRENGSAAGQVFAYASAPDQVMSGLWGRNTAAWQAQVGPSTISPQMSRPAWPSVAPAWPSRPVPPPAAVPAQIEEGRECEEDEEDEEISLFERIENILIIVISSLLLAILLIIVLALSSDEMNTFFFHLLHIDIRTEILYLLQLR